MVNPKTAVWADLYPFESHWLELPSARMHYIDEGPRDAPVLFFVHGNPTWSFYWRNLILHFRDRFRCVAMDHIGCGLSDKPEDYPYTLAQRIADVETLAETLNLERITMVVHDWGGAIGMGFAGRHPDKIERFVIFNTAAFRSKTIPFSIALCRIPVFGALAVRGLNGFVEVAQFRAIFDRDRLKSPVRQGYVDPYDSWKNRVAIHRFVQDIPMSPSHPSWATLTQVEEGLAQFADTPMVIIWGDDDFCFDTEFRHEWERRFPKAKVWSMPDASHYVVEDAIDRVIPWMDEFLGN